jgi:hypothetical protein
VRGPLTTRPHRRLTRQVSLAAASTKGKRVGNEERERNKSLCQSVNRSGGALLEKGVFRLSDCLLSSRRGHASLCCLTFMIISFVLLLCFSFASLWILLIGRGIVPTTCHCIAQLPTRATAGASSGRRAGVRRPTRTTRQPRPSTSRSFSAGASSRDRLRLTRIRMPGPSQKSQRQS